MARIDFVTGSSQHYLADVEAFALVAEQASAVIAGRSTADLLQPPGRGEWPAARVLQHMTFWACENHVNLDRMVRQQEPDTTMWDELEFIRSERLNLLEGPELLQRFADAIAETVELLRELPDASWGRAGLHPRAGRRSIRQMVRGQANHFRQHLDQLRTSLDAAG